MEERDGSLGAGPRRRVDQLHPVDRQPGQRGGDVGNLEADVVEALASGGEEARHAGRGVGRLDELDPDLPDGQERDADAIRGDRHDRTRREPQDVPIEAERRAHLAHHHGNVMDAADAMDGGRQARKQF